MKALGKHLLIELQHCDVSKIGTLEYVRDAMVEAAEEARATIVEVAFHEFSPFGVSGMVIIAESHLAIHTWPEYGYAAVDIFTCGEVIDPMVAAKFLVDTFDSKIHIIREVNRGVGMQFVSQVQ